MSSYNPYNVFFKLASLVRDASLILLLFFNKTCSYIIFLDSRGNTGRRRLSLFPLRNFKFKKTVNFRFQNFRFEKKSYTCVLFLFSFITFRLVRHQTSFTIIKVQFCRVFKVNLVPFLFFVLFYPKISNF